LRFKKQYGQENAGCIETNPGVLTMAFLIGIITSFYRDIPPWSA